MVTLILAIISFARMRYTDVRGDKFLHLHAGWNSAMPDVFARGSEVAHLLQRIGGREESEELARGRGPHAHGGARARQVRHEALLLALAPAVQPQQFWCFTS